MNSKTGTLMASIAIGLVCLFYLAQPAIANTVQVKTTGVDVCTGGPICAGTVTQGGILNGTSLTVFSATVTPTADPKSFRLARSIWRTVKPRGFDRPSSSLMNLFPA